MLNDTNNAAWLEAEILRVARIERTVEIEPAIKNLSRECKDRGYPQRMTDLRQMITDARRAEVDDATEAEAEATRESGVWRGRTVRVDTEDKEATAEQFLGAMFQHPKGWRLVFWRDSFYEWQTTHWTPTDANELKHDLRLWLAEECFEATNKGFGPVKPTIRLVEEVMAALKALTLYEGANSTGWLTRTKPAAHPMSVRNGILDLGTRTLHPHTPTLFNLHYVDADWDQNAPDLMDTPAGPWLMEAFGADQIPLLQEFTGYFLTGRTDAQKALMIIGPPRSGKGTYGRVLAALLGGNMASMSARTMGNQFGREGLLDKPVCIMPDMRVGKNTDKVAVAETLLGVIGEDWVEVPRKYKTPWHGKLDTRFLIMSNSVPWL
ncbi:DUF5906 domain-containing protein [Ruegeria arenilitoris]|uniref:DUF5906 domain-containing protein n=1 Tax=Ruegeria arenilitoris TaxID=1173585 RepID=UPI00147B70FA|nr:DUF5906 domain-containing protein [Ruegeria arenilitoris]